MLVSALWAHWTGNNLIINDEYVGNDFDLVNLVHLHSPYEKVIGNSLMFNNSGDDLFYQYSRSGVFINECYKYDEFGAIRYLNNLNKKIC